jgi:hypothetical protein
LPTSSEFKTPRAPKKTKQTRSGQTIVRNNELNDFRAKKKKEEEKIRYKN